LNLFRLIADFDEFIVKKVTNNKSLIV